MADRSKIEWTDSTWNPIRARDRETGKIGWFCVHESEGCRFCYAEALNRRLGTGIDFKAQNRDKVELFLDEEMLSQPLRWKRPRRIFVDSMSDLFADFVPDEWLHKIFAVMATAGKSRRHTFLVLTKRAERMRAYLRRIEEGSAGAVERYMNKDSYQEGVRARMAMPESQRLCEPSPPTPQLRHLYDLAPMPLDFSSRSASGEYHWQKWPLDRVWMGVSVEDQPRWNERWPHLAATPAAVRWISYEPALGPLNIDALGGPDWLVVGGESGPGARPFKIEWARSIIAQCKAANVAVFCKQLGAVPIIEDVPPFNGSPNGTFASGFPDGTFFGNRTGRRELNGLQVLLRHRKGGDMEEWAPDLRVREHPLERA